MSWAATMDSAESESPPLAIWPRPHPLDHAQFLSVPRPGPARPRPGPFSYTPKTWIGPAPDQLGPAPLFLATPRTS